VVSRVDGCISSALETDEHLRAVGRTDFARIGVPADEERFDRSRVLEDLREEAKLPNDVPVVCFVARLVDFKDPLTFLRAAKVLRDRGTRFHFVVAGDGNLGDDCRKLIAEEGVSDHVTMIGMRTDTERVFRISDVSVHVSPTENTWSTSIAEAMQMDVPVVLTDAGYTTRVFSHEKDCLIVPVGDHVTLADSIARLLGDRELRSSLTSGAWDLMRAYNKDSVSMSRAIRDYYEKVAGARAEKRR
jgi:glycosyltransferase involved in cell wall biosynthesis